MSERPPRPWTKGRHGTHDVAHIVVSVVRDNHGRVYSSHDAQTAEDRRIMLGWPSHGMDQAAFALLVEAVRREALIGVLLGASKDPSTSDAVRAMTPDERTGKAESMADTLVEALTGTVRNLAVGALREALDVFDEMKPDLP